MKLLINKVRIILLTIGILIISLNCISQSPELILPTGYAKTNMAVFSPDGKFVLTACNDNCAKLWDVRTGKFLRDYKCPSSKVESAEFSPITQDDPSGGKYLVTTGNFGSCIVWETETSKKIVTLKGDLDPLHYAIYSPDGQYILSCGSEDNVILWNTKNFDKCKKIFTCKNASISVGFSPITSEFTNGSKYFLVVHNNNTFSYYETLTGKKIGEAVGNIFSSKKAFSRNGRHIIFSEKENVCVIDIQTGKRIFYKDGGSGIVNTAFYSPTSNNSFEVEKYIIASYNDGKILIWDTETGEILNVLDGELGPVIFADFTPDGSRAIAYYQNGLALIWDWKAEKVLTHFEYSIDKFLSSSFGVNEDKVLTICNNTAILWNSFTGRMESVLNGLKKEKTVATFWSDDNSILALTRGSDAKIIDLANLRIKEKLSERGGILKVGYSPKKSFIFTIGDYSFSLWSTENYKKEITISYEKNEYLPSITFSPDESCFALLNNNNKVLIYESSSGILKQEIVYYDTLLKAAIDFQAKYIVTANISNLQLWEINTTELIYDINAFDSFITSILFSPANSNDPVGGKYILTSTLGDDTFKFDTTNKKIYRVEGSEVQVKLWESRTGKLINEFVGHNGFVNTTTFSHDGTMILSAGMDNILKLWSTNTAEILKEFGGHNGQIENAVFCPDSISIITYGVDGLIKIWDISSGSLIFNLNEDNGDVEYVDISSDQSLLLSSGTDNNSKLWDYKTGKEIASIIFVGLEEWFVVVPEFMYFSTKNATARITWKIGTTLFSFEQFDLKYNRPDIVLARLGYASQELIDAYYQAYQKRLKKMGFTEEQLSGEFHIPESAIENFEYMPVIEEKDIDIELNFNDSKYNLDRYNIWLNDVPLFGMQGKSLKEKNAKEFTVKEKIELAEGRNKIQVSCLNGKGAESYKETVEITYNPKTNTQPTLYFVGIGVDKYIDPGYNLNYSVKDIRDLSAMFSQKYPGNIVIDTLFNENVSISNVLAIKEKLLQSTVNDKVIISFSGHGLLSSTYDYYLATHTTNFKMPEQGGLPYEQLEWLLDSIPARQKLLLIDACHSGEVDKDELLVMQNTNNSEELKGAELAYEYEPVLGMKNSFELMQELFANLNRGTGATIISAAAGNQFAYEKGNLKNGVFTYSILELMNSKKKITVSALKEAVGKRVEELTNGLQKPTSRTENLENDWRVW